MITGPELVATFCRPAFNHVLFDTSQEAEAEADATKAAAVKKTADEVQAFILFKRVLFTSMYLITVLFDTSQEAAAAQAKADAEANAAAAKKKADEVLLSPHAC